jgi:amidase
MAASADTELAFAGAAALAERVRSKDVTPREVVELFLRRIDELNPKLNAFRVVMADQALAAADALAQHAGDPDRPLLGVPVAVKDDLPVEGQAMTWGSRTFNAPQAKDSEAVRRLRAAGAIPIGITNVPELMIFPWTATEANGVTRNPWNPERTTGGSSGGSGAAVASGMVPIATGSDGGGSIRIPAACCGLVGMKPTRGRVSTQPAADGWLGLSVYGPLTRSVLDSALMLDAMSGAVTGDTDRLDPPSTPFAQAAATPPGKLRIAISRKIPAGLIAKLSADQRGAWESTASLLRELGHDVSERHPSYGLRALEFTANWTRGIYEDSLKMPDPGQYERLTRQLARVGKLTVPPWRKRRLLAGRAKSMAGLLKLWDDVDVLLTPGLASTAIEADGGFRRALPIAFNKAAAFTPWTPLFNLTGQPAVTLPAGQSPDGMPLSVQLVGRPGDEGTLYSLAAQIEQARPWAEQRPGIS